MLYVLEAKPWKDGRSGLERLWVRPLAAHLTGAGAPQLFVCLRLQSYTRGIKNQLTAGAPCLLFQALRILLTFHKGSMKLEFCRGMDKCH